MSKGNPIYTVRIGLELSNAILRDMANRKNSNGREDLSFGEWIRLAILEKLEHMRRGRKASKRRTLKRQVSKESGIKDLKAHFDELNALGGHAGIETGD